LNEARHELHQVILGLGSNIEPQENLPRAVDLLCEHVTIQAISRAWETPAVGNPAPDFLNAAIQVLTPLPPDELKRQVIHPIEARLGRVRTADKNAPRTVDIDILAYDGEILDPLVWEQAYLAVPLAELAPGHTHPETGESIAHAAVRLARLTRFEPRPTVLPGLWDCTD
jgi:2-amino-4-hydroxy-6-hydroxymethyldihydropteridine diphosphokinase